MLVMIWAFHVLLAGSAALNFEGNLFLWTLSAAIAALSLQNALNFKSSPSNMYLGILLWVGLWFKVAVHILLQYPFMEPTGNFSGQPHEWNNVLWVIITGQLAYIGVSYLTRNYLPKSKNAFELSKQKSSTQAFSFIDLKWLLGFLIVTMTIIGAINVALGVTISGMHAATTLMWPINAVSGWFLYIGFGILVCFYAQLEFDKKRKEKTSTSLSILEGLISSLSIMSRGLYFFHVVPYFHVLLVNKEKLSLNLTALTKRAIAASLVLVFCLTAVTCFRNALYSDLLTNQNFKYTGVSFLKLKNMGGAFNQVFSQVSRLFVDRWVGAEGVMAMVAHPEKSPQNFFESFSYVPQIGKRDVYQKIISSQYKADSNWSFSFIPGLLATLYYSGSYLIVFLGCFLVFSVLFLLDQLLARSFSMAFLSTYLGFYFAMSFSQLGLGYKPIVISFIMTGSFLVFSKGLLLLLSLQWSELKFLFSKQREAQNLGSAD